MLLYLGKYYNTCFNKQHNLLCHDYKWWMHQSGDCNPSNGFATAEYAKRGAAINN